MRGLTAAGLARACQIFLRTAYPEGEHTIPAPQAAFLALDPNQPLEQVLRPPLCQPLPARGGGVRGHAIRLGSAAYPHLKLQVVACGEDPCVFAVDTHDLLRVEPGDLDAPRWAALRAANRRLKEEIERAWEAEGLCTFNGLLRRQLSRA